MPTRKINVLYPSYKVEGCFHPEHNPPTHMVYENGTYEHTCPGCGNKIIFTVRNPTY